MTDTAKFAIDKGIPLPARRSPGRGETYPWVEMDVGDSFFVPGKATKGFSSAVSAASRRHRRKFARRDVEENGVPGVRVWRVE